MVVVVAHFTHEPRCIRCNRISNFKKIENKRILIFFFFAWESFASLQWILVALVCACVLIFSSTCPSVL